MLRISRQISDAYAFTIDKMDEAGIRPVDAYSYMAKEVGGEQYLGFLPKDCSNFLQNKRNNILEAGDAQHLIDYFKSLQVGDPSFFYSVQVDAENHLTNFFWRDGRSKVDYSYFGDVVIFDTTYRTNKYNMICAPFVGVNHHWQNVLFGCAFLLDETTSSFIWLFKTFMEAMEWKQPRTIFTDQCAAMANAIENVMQCSRHRLTLLKMLLRNFQNTMVSLILRNCLILASLIDCQTIEEFELKWSSLLNKYNLYDNSWIQNLYKYKEKWAPVYSKDTFSASILSSQRSENMNSVFRYFTKKTMTLTKFVHQYEKIVQRRREKELFEDFRCNHSQPIRIFNENSMEKQVANIYTEKIFKKFQEELMASISIVIQDIRYNSSTRDHNFKLIGEATGKENSVTYSYLDGTISCSCKKIESVGILCAHALKVLNLNNIFQIPSQYILKRWTKDAKVGIICHENVVEAKDSFGLRRSKLMNKAAFVVSKAMMTEETQAFFDTFLDAALKNIEDMLKVMTKKDLDLEHLHSESEHEVIEEHLNSSLVSQRKLLDPLSVHPKGVSRRRMKNCLERKRKKVKTPASKLIGKDLIAYQYFVKTLLLVICLWLLIIDKV
ncbi:hypothetical protein J5N97_013765 [Dioscorea zingiberensis]|uniref:Protein FAR1-RELATED SEQUENCE n=1 Tax=Dioscorea zingiberensis TaxID=325984 RepID=A0A9D5CR54_9LILI|nr:hypothetical protein J5N97_013765 [Dioscorea zingiberensis]